MRRLPVYVVLLILPVLLLLSACQMGELNLVLAADDSSTSLPPPIPTNLPVTQTPTATPSNTPTPTVTSTSTLTPLPSATPTITSTPTASETPTATLSPTPDTSTVFVLPTSIAPYEPPEDGEAVDLEDWWMGNARWKLEIADTGLPVGESDTIYMGDGVYYSYVHASYASAGVRDSCGDPVPFPGCATRWVSTDNGHNFSIADKTCIFACTTCPCDGSDHMDQQQYPRIFRDDDTLHMVYEHGAASWLSQSKDGVVWTQPQLVVGTGMWFSWMAPCTIDQAVNPHPFWSSPLDCMVGGPPGIYIENNRMYLFVGLGQNPGHMGCLWADMDDLSKFRLCNYNPTMSGAPVYGPIDAAGTAAKPFYDFRFVTSADIVQVGDHYYMSYEGIRGPNGPSAGRDNQFSLGFARSDSLDSRWEKYPGNPLFGGVVDNWGIGHADIVIVDGATYLYTATPLMTRGRYVLVPDN